MLRACLCSTILVVALVGPIEAVAQTDDQVSAAAVARRASEAYEAGEFPTAAILLEEAIALYETPALHYNFARTLSELSRWDESRTHFLRFLELDPEADQRAAVEARLEELNRRIAQIEEEDTSSSAPPENEPRPPPEAPAEPPREARVGAGPWIVMSVGLLVGAGAIAPGLASNRAETRAANAATHSDGIDELDEAHRLARITNGLIMGGAAVALVGLIWTIVRARRAPSAPSSVAFDGTSVRVSF